LCFDDVCENTRLVTTDLGSICAPSLALEHGRLSPACAPIPPAHTTENSVVLWQNVPNPCNPATTIAFRTPEPGPVTLRIFSADGRLVSLLQDSHLPDGVHELRWNGLDVLGRPAPSGVYFYRLSTPQASLSRRMLLLR
jgi:hypothetical protein